MRVTVERSQLKGSIRAVSSKSYAHRMLIAAALSSGDVTIGGINCSADIEATVGVLRSIGYSIEIDGDRYTVGGRTAVAKATADCRECGSTLRFCLPLVAALGVETEFFGSERLLSRPNEKLIDCLNSHGADIVGYHVRGGLSPGRYVIDPTVSSQYITGLLMALPVLDGDSEIVLDGEMVSAGYVDITLDVLSMAGIEVSRVGNAFFVRGNQVYRMPDSEVNGDWSNAAFFLVAGAIGENEVTVTNLKRDCQGDRAICDIIRRFGGQVRVEGDAVTVSSGEFRPLIIDMEDTPDLAPITAVLLSMARGSSLISGVSRLTVKESNRLTAIIEMLGRGGIEASYDGEKITVVGGTPCRGKYIGYNDHRMVMSSAILSTVSGGEIEGAEAISKSYPNFFSDMAKIGGKIL